MPSRLHEGMTRTRRPSRGGTRRRAVTIALSSGLLILLGWAAVSTVGGPGEREARAQTSDQSGGSGEIAQAETPPEDSPEPGAGEEEEYAAFGEYKDPFVAVVGEAEETDGGGGDSGGDNDDDSGGGGSVSDADVPDEGNGGDSDSITPPEDGAGDASTDSSAQGDTGPSPKGDGESSPSGVPAGVEDSGSASGAVEGTDDEEDVDCADPEDRFEELLCEEETAEAAPDGAAVSSGGGPGSGGSGRSGVDEPAEDFRSDGAPPLK